MISVHIQYGCEQKSILLKFSSTHRKKMQTNPESEQVSEKRLLRQELFAILNKKRGHTYAENRKDQRAYFLFQCAL